MLPPGERALTRDQAFDVLATVEDLYQRLDHLKAGLRSLLDQADPAGGADPADRADRT
jgi:hypothetical protein